jgi:hypothetical protein
VKSRPSSPARHGTPEQRRAAARFLAPGKSPQKPQDARDGPDGGKIAPPRDGHQAARRPGIAAKF